MTKKIKIQTNKKVKQVCPVCRNGNTLLTIHHILPRYIFKEIPEMKKMYFNGTNDYWLCRNCHAKYEKRANVLRNKLLNLFNYPDNAESTVLKISELAKIKNLCRYMTGKFPENRYEYSIYEAYKFIIDFYGVKYMAYDDIEAMSNMKDVGKNPNFINAGQFLLGNMSIRGLDGAYRKDLIGFLTKRSVKLNNLIPQHNKNYEKI